MVEVVNQGEEEEATPVCVVIGRQVEVKFELVELGIRLFSEGELKSGGELVPVVVVVATA